MKKLRALLSAALMIMLSVSIAVAGTYALFSDSVEVTNHLQAGTLELGLTRTKLVKSVPDATTGMPTKTEDATARDFSAATSENVFGIGDEKIAPGSWYEVEMRVINKGTVAFNYRVAIELDSATTAENLAFAEQLTVYVNGAAEGTKLSDCKIENGKIIVSDKLVQKNATEEKFTVKIVFNSLAGNAAQGKEVTFDLIVMAEQYVPAETTV